jgi:N-acetylglucosamine repressor
LNKATRSQTKQHNTRLVLRTMYNNANLSRADIARVTSLTRPTVSSIVEELINRNLVTESRLGPSTGGKRPIILEFSKNSQEIVCLDLSGTGWVGGLLNLRGELLQKTVVPIPGRGPEMLLEEVLHLVRSLLMQATAPVLGIGIASPGLVDSVSGVIAQAVNLGWRDLPLKRLLQERFGLPVYLANDSHLAALAEYHADGHSSSEQNLIAVKLGAGVGAGIVIRGRLFTGDGHNAGEIGHVVVDSDGPLCMCGNYGCLEALVSGRILASRLHEIQAKVGYTGQLAEDGFVLAQQCLQTNYPPLVEQTKQLLDKVAVYLGQTFAQLAGTLNINELILVGTVRALGETFLQQVHKNARRSVLPSLADQLHLRYSSLPESALLGCATLVLAGELGIL